MTDRQENEAVTVTMTGFVPPMRVLRDRIAVDGPFDTVTFAAKSDRWPEEVRVTARNKLWVLYFSCDSNEVCGLHLWDQAPRPPRARLKAGFFFKGLLKGASIKPLCEAIPSVVQGLRKFLENPVESDLDEARRQGVRTAFDEHTTALDSLSLLPLSAFDEAYVATLASQFMCDNPDIFNHPNVDVRTIYRTSEVRDWLLARSDVPSKEQPEFKLLCYCVFRTVQKLCGHASIAEARNRYS